MAAVVTKVLSTASRTFTKFSAVRDEVVVARI
jgi:hypothetical protein